MMLLVIQSHGQGHSTEISAPNGSEFTINGLIIGGPAEYGEEDLIAAFGQPDNVLYDYSGVYTYVYNRDMTEKPGGYVPVMNHSEIAVFNRHGRFCNQWPYRSRRFHIEGLRPRWEVQDQ